MKPLAVDLCCGLGGWTSGLLAEGWDAVGFDVERHQYGDEKYPAQLVLQDIFTIDGRQFRGKVSLIVASPPCQEFSYMAMPWSRAKTIAAEYQSGARDVRKLTALFDACVRIGREAECPIVIENVRGAQPWVGRSRWAWGSFHLWGDVPALMPIGKKFKSSGMNWSNRDLRGQDFTRIAGRQSLVADGQKTIGHANIRDGYSHTRHLTNPTESEGVKFSQSGAAWFDGQPRDKMLGDKGPAALGSKSNARKAASAMIAKIPLPLAQYIAQVYKPQQGRRHERQQVK